MVSVAHTLGVAHPPGYPVYALVSKLLLTLIPWGNAGYRLNVLSALAGAGTAVLLYRCLLQRAAAHETRAETCTGKLTAAFAAILFATSYLQWYLSLVSEMYTMNTLFAAALLFLAVRMDAQGDIRLGMCAAFLLGLGMGNRMDLVMLAPGFVWLGLAFRQRNKLSLRHLALLGILFLLGFSVFLYLPLRSGTGPLLDWNHPANLEHFWGSLTRKTHGGTLDLVSAPYAAGANLASSLTFYGRHTAAGLAWGGILFAVIGLASLYKQRPAIAGFTFLSWLFAGPVFIYMANIPPNPHALAILEAHFLLPNLFVAYWAGTGLYAVGQRAASLPVRAGMVAVAGILCCSNGYANLPAVYKRANLVAYDYAKNVLRSLPRQAIVVIKKDVQLFALWNQQAVLGRRPDAAIVGQGLAGAGWYQAAWTKQHPDTVLCRLETPADWAQLCALNPRREIFVAADADYTPVPPLASEPAGLLARVQGTTPPDPGILLREIYARRGRFMPELYDEFFTPNILEDYSRGWMTTGSFLVKQGNYPAAREAFAAAESLQPLFPAARNSRAYAWFQEGKYAEARREYQAAAFQYRALLERAAAYNTLPDTIAAIRKDLAGVYVSIGVCGERTQDDAASLAAYQQALEIDPGMAKIYFNRAVIYWRHADWQRVIQELEQALRVDPAYQEAAFYLQKARQNAGAGRKL